MGARPPADPDALSMPAPRGDGSVVWRDGLARQEQNLLSRGTSAALPPAADVVVVGGGIAGLSTAYACHVAGHGRVVVIERDGIASGPSGSAAGLLNPDTYEATKPPAFVSLASRGLEVHRRWGDAAGYRVRDVDIRTVSPGDDLLAPSQGHIDPLRCAIALAGSGMESVIAAVTRIVPLGGGVQVETTIGTITAGAAIVATGTLPVASALQRWVKGHLLATEPASFRLPAVVSGEVFAIQLDDGRLVAGGTLDAGRDPRVEADVVRSIRRRLTELVPESGTLPTAHTWTCFRPANAGEQVVIDRLGDAPVWTIGGLYRNGMMLAPAAGEVVAEWIGSGARPPAADGFALQAADGR